MVNNIVGLIREPVKEALKNNKEFSLLAKKKNGSGYYQIKEYIGYLRSSEVNTTRTDMNNLEIVFANGKVVKTIAYVDGIIEPNTFISVYGYMYKFNETIQLACCLGVERVFDTIPSILQYANEINLERPHIIKAILNLSEAKESKEYSVSESIKPFKDTKFFYIEEESKNELTLLSGINYDTIKHAVSLSAELQKDNQNNDDFDCSDEILNQTINSSKSNSNM